MDQEIIITQEDTLNMLDTLLEKKGIMSGGTNFFMTCFNLDGGANISDYDVYRD